MKVHKTRSHAHASLKEEGKPGKVGTRKQKGDSKGQEYKNKKAKVEGDANGKSAANVSAEFDEFCKVAREHLSIAEMRAILEANEQEPSGSDDVVVPRCQDVMFYGPLERCPYCKSQLECTGKNYVCSGSYNEWTTCPYSTRNPTRKGWSLKFPDRVNDSTIADWVKKLESRPYPQREWTPIDKPLSGMAICLSGRLSRTHVTKLPC